MNGLGDYNKSYQRKINNIINGNRTLQGYYNYIMNGSTISTCYMYVFHVADFLKNINKNVDNLDASDFLNYMSKFNNGSKSYSQSYKISVYHALKRFGDYLVVMKKQSENLMDFVPRPKSIESQKTIEKREVGYLTPDEARAFLDNAAAMSKDKWKWRDLSILMIFLNTGIRCSALYKLDVNNINLEEGTILVTDKEQKVSRKMISEDTVECLRKWLEVRKDILGSVEEDALFISTWLRRLSRDTIAKMVKKYSININGKNITPHKLRATYGTYLYNQTNDIYFVQQCLGHSSPKTSELYIRGQRDICEAKSEELTSKFFK